MEKADFIGKLKLIDDWTTFDSARFDQILEESDQIEPITANELALMADVVGVIVDKEWFQIYDNLSKFTETYVGSGMYWNYFYNVWKTISHSPYSNAVVFVKDTATTTAPNTLTFTVADKETSADATIFTLEPVESTASLGHSAYNFVQTETATENGVAIHRYGAIIVPTGAEAVGKLQAKIGEDTYETASAFALNTAQGATVTLTKV